MAEMHYAQLQYPQKSGATCIFFYIKSYSQFRPGYILG